MESLAISAKKLGQLGMRDFCPRCFWLRLHTEWKLPFEGPFPGIFNSIDGYSKGIIHDYFDRRGRLPGWYPSVGDVATYVPSKDLHWRRFSATDTRTNIKLWGSPDELLRLKDGSTHIVDYKTGKLTGTQDELLPMYVVQLNAYAFICSSEKTEFAPVSGLSLIYTEPRTDLRASTNPEVMSRQGFALHFSATLRPVKLEPRKMIRDLLGRVRAIYDQQPAPKGRPGCEDCDRFARVVLLAGEE
jgi:PD-(D/E)XK nuclease superfamily protein